jgi:hypothetical protein
MALRQSSKADMMEPAGVVVLGQKSQLQVKK